MKLQFSSNLRQKLIAILIASLFIGLASVGTLLYYQFRAFLHDGVRKVLISYVNLAEQSLDVESLASQDRRSLKAYVDLTSKLIECRLTIIDPSGLLIADSELTPYETTLAENHINRPEIVQASSENYGFGIRHSATIKKDLLYLGKRVEKGGKIIGYLRLAMFAEQTDQLLSAARAYFMVGGLLILLLSGFLVVILSRRINQNLEEVTRKARQIARGDLDVSIEVTSNDELQELAACLKDMAEKMSGHLTKLSQERFELDAVLSSVNDGIIAIGPDRKIVFLNHIALQLLENPASATDRQYYYKVLRNQHLTSLLNNFFEKPLLISDVIHLSDMVLEVVISPFQIEVNSKKAGAVIVLRNVTQFKKLEKIRRDFVANVSHEFKTPLAAIRGYSETLLDWALDEPEIRRKYVEKILKQSDQLENLVSDLLHLARIERLQSIKFTAFNPHTVIDTVVDGFAEMAEAKKQELSVELAQPDRSIEGDPEMFRSIIANLLDNAIKYTPESGHIKIKSHYTDGHAIISVADNGMGIPEKYQERVFERFYRVDKARSRFIGGTGLGLSIVKHLVELQQAQIWLESKENAGSCFSLKFQLADKLELKV